MLLWSERAIPFSKLSQLVSFHEYKDAQRLNFQSENSFFDIHSLKEKSGASLVAQWLRICLPMQGTRVRALVWGDPTYRGATRSVSHNC